MTLILALAVAIWADPGRNRWGALAALLLLVSLACTPCSRWLGWRRSLTWRRPLGLYAFVLAAVHLGLFLVGSDTFLDNPSAWFGAACFAILTLLAMTSTRSAQRRLGRAWKKLHRLVYLAGLCLCLHVGLAGQASPWLIALAIPAYLGLMILRLKRG
ncbi:MAG: hypothetical protein AMXMBFR33_63800 [Candidatus Xenobia bacterium]